MTLLDTMARRDGEVREGARPFPAWRVEVAADVDAASRAWLSLEVGGILTPYQTLGWQRAAMATLDAGATPCVALLRDPGDGIATLLPLVVRRRMGCRVAAFAGGKHANYNMGLFRPDAMAAMTADGMRAALAAVAAAAGIDLFALRNQPRLWAGRANPMTLLPHQPAASGAWRAELTADPDAFVAGLMSSESRKKLRHKERRLAELGPVAFVEARSAAEARTFLDAFLVQKQARFKAMGAGNPFDAPEAMAFLDRVAVRTLDAGPPAPVLLHALTIGDRVAAVFGGAVHGGRYSGMFTSFDSAPDIARFSPGDLLLLHLVRSMCARGLSGFDLGTGDAAYKSSYCPIRDELFDSFVPMSARGAALAAALAAAYRAKAAAASRKALLKPLRALLGR
jgi:CelD/BcsL family acetyltransferase involved in cellulose biosynthesis